MTTRLTCYACGRTASPEAGQRCDCGEPLWYETDDGADRFDWTRADRARGAWAYADLLPADSPAGVGVGAAAGGTPLVRTPPLDDYAGVRVHVKDEGQNPTGSFKDRGSAVGVAAAVAGGARAVGTVSHGNMAMSTAAHAAGAGVGCVVLVPADIPAERLRNIARFDPRIVRVEGDYGRLYEESLELGPELGVEFVNSDSPLRTAGQKTTALEAVHAFAAGDFGDEGSLPDALVLPTSSGGHASATWKALLDLEAAGLLDRAEFPRLYLVQAAACAPVARAFERDLDAVEPVEGGETVAYSIANADPPSGTRALTAARETGGAVVAVDDDAILDAKRAFGRRAGFAVETASATTLAGARLLADRGELGPDEDAVLVVTGSGFKESTDDGATPEAETVALEDLRAVLS